MSAERKYAAALPAIRQGLARGAFWGAINVTAGRALQFVSTLVLAQILAPEHFGALAVAQVVQTIAMNMAELGATSAIGRADRDPDKIAPTVFTLSFGTSVLVTIAVMALAGPLAQFMGDPGATQVIQVMSLTILLAGLSGVPAAMVWREYLQKPRTVVELVGAIVSFALVIPFAAMGWGAFALVWSRVIGQLLITIGYWIVTPARYGFGFHRETAAYVLRLGAPLAGANLLVFVTLNLDYIIIGRELGPAELGVYLLAFNLAALPSTLISAVIRTVAVPTFGRLYVAGTLKSKIPILVASSAYLGHAISALLVGLSLPLVAVLYGPNWAQAGTAMAGLAIFGAGRILTEMLADICVGAGKTGALLWIQALWLVALLPVMLLSVRWGGIWGAGVGHAIVVWAVIIPAYLIAVRKVLGASIAPTLRRCTRPTLAALAAGVVSWLCAQMLSNNWLALIIGGILGLATFAALTLGYSKELIRDLKDLTGDPEAVDAAESPATHFMAPTPSPAMDAGQTTDISDVLKDNSR